MFRRIQIIMLVFFGSFLFISCSSEITGEFGWARTDDRDIEDLEKIVTHVREYNLDVDYLHFYAHETIWWMYIIRSGSYEKDGFLAALYENNNTPQPVEVDLRQVYVEESSGEEMIRQSYSPLSPGRYLLRLMHNSVIIDEKDFIVMPSPGTIDFNEEVYEDQKKIDPIMKYSGL